MAFALFNHDLGLAANDTPILDRALELAEIVMTQHLKPEHKLLHELVQVGDEMVDTDPGNTFIPGHAIESMWLMFHIYGYHDNQAVAYAVHRPDVEMPGEVPDKQVPSRKPTQQPPERQKAVSSCVHPVGPECGETSTVSR